MPWLVFHLWLSTITLLHHTAPHIPFEAEGRDYDAAQAIVNGTVTVSMPRLVLAGKQLCAIIGHDHAKFLVMIK